MSSTFIGLAVLPVVFFMVIVMECSRLHCARLVQRRLATPAGRKVAGEEITRS